jgi:hypothetical protein
MLNKIKQLVSKWLYKDTLHEYKFVFYAPKNYSHRLFKYFVDLYHEGGGLYFKEPIHETESIDSFEMTVVCTIDHASQFVSEVKKQVQYLRKHAGFMITFQFIS